MAWRLYLVLAFTFLATTSREPPWADAHVVYDTSRAIVERHALDITLDGPPQFFVFRSVPEAAPATRAAAGAPPSVKKYGVFPLGNVIAMVPSYLAFRALRYTRLFPEEPLYALCSHISPALLMAGACLVFFSLARRRGASERLATLLTFAMAFSTLCFCYARSPYSEALQTLLLLLLVRVTLEAGERLTLAKMALIGIYAGALFNTKLVNALLLPVIPIYLGYRAFELQRQSGESLSKVRSLEKLLAKLILPFAVSLLSFAPFVGFALWHNWLKTGSLWQTGYRLPHGLFSGDLFAGIYSFLFSTGKSVFLYSPPLFLMWFSVGTAWRKRRDETAFIGAIIAVALLWNSQFRGWHGDYCWGPRHLAPFVPLGLLLLLPWLPEALARGWVRLRQTLLALLLVWGLGAQLVGAALYWDHYIRILIAVKDQTGAPGWFQEQLGHAHYMPQFSPLRGHLWLLEHMARHDADLNRDAPWKLLVPQPFDLRAQFASLRIDWWLLDFRPSHPPAQRYPLALPLLLGVFLGGLLLGGIGLGRRLRRSPSAE